jgi:hypothetical protein
MADEEAGPRTQKVCRKCSTVSDTVGDFCPNCGTPYAKRGPMAKRRARRDPWSRRRKIITAVALLVLLLGAAGAGAYLKIEHDNDVEADRRAEERREEQEQQDEQDAQEVEEEADKLQATLRTATVKELEQAITKDARSRVAEGIVDGPIMRTECTPEPGEDPEDPSVTRASYSCIAVNEENLAEGTLRGPAFSGTIDFDKGSFTWHLGQE